jgi:putative phage-type endonuclease
MTGRLIRHPRYAPGTPDWHAQRALAVGGSEIAAVLGVSPWESRFSLWHKKKGLVDPNLTDTEQLYWGRMHEPTIAARFAADHPEWKVKRTGTFTPSGRPFQIVSPDRDVQIERGTHRPAEIKTSRDDVGWGTPGTDEVPIYYRVQGIWQADALGADRCYFGVLFAGSEYQEYVVPYDRSEATILLDAAAEFVQSLKRDERPDIDEHGATYQVVRELHPEIDGTDYQVSADLARRFCLAKEAARAADAESQYATSLIADAMGNARRAMFGETRLGTRQSKSGGLPYLQSAKADSLPAFPTTNRAA